MTLLNHPGVSLSTLAQEYRMLEKRECVECLAACWYLLRAGADGDLRTDYHTLNPLRLKLDDENPPRLRFVRMMRRKPIDYIAQPFRTRQSMFVKEAVVTALRSMQFRSTRYVGHEVFIDVTRKVTRVFAKRVKAEKKDILIPTAPAMHKTWKMHIYAEVCAKSWARVYLRGLAIINGVFFVTEIVKDRSPKDVRVRYYKQSRGYTLAYGEADAYLGSDGKWRTANHEVIVIPKRFLSNTTP